MHIQMGWVQCEANWDLVGWCWDKKRFGEDSTQIKEFNEDTNGLHGNVVVMC